MNRRRLLLASSLATAASPWLGLSAASAAPFSGKLKIGFIYPGPVADMGWTFQHDLGRRMIEKEFGARVETTFVEKVPEGPDADRVIRQLAADGCKLIFTTSFGFMDPTQRLAQEFPDVIFEHCSGYKMAANVGIYQTRFYEGAYLLGLLAGRMTRSNVIGYVAPFPIPEVKRNLNAWVIGARAVNPKVTARVVWVNTWYDPGKEREAAMALTGVGCDVMYQNTDSPSVVQVAQSKGLYAFGQDSDMSVHGKDAHLSANTVNWGVYYVKKVRDVLAGTWKAEDTKWGMKEGMIVLSPLNHKVPRDLAELYETRRKAVAAGTLQPFAGPLADQAGKVRVAAGATLPESELWTLDWYAQGIEGKQP